MDNTQKYNEQKQMQFPVLD